MTDCNRWGSNAILVLMIMMVMMLTMGCRPYPKPIIDEVANNETAFFNPLLEGDTDAQVKFDSVDFLGKRKSISSKENYH